MLRLQAPGVAGAHGGGRTLAEMPQNIRQLKAEHLKARADAELKAGELRSAIERYSEAASLKPSTAILRTIHSNRSLALHKAGKFAEALAAADEAVEASPEWPKAHWRRGAALRGLRRGLDAVAAHREAWRLSRGGAGRGGTASADTSALTDAPSAAATLAECARSLASAVRALTKEELAEGLLVELARLRDAGEIGEMKAELPSEAALKEGLFRSLADGREAASARTRLERWLKDPPTPVEALWARAHACCGARAYLQAAEDARECRGLATEALERAREGGGLATDGPGGPASGGGMGGLETRGPWPEPEATWLLRSHAALARALLAEEGHPDRRPAHAWLAAAAARDLASGWKERLGSGSVTPSVVISEAEAEATAKLCERAAEDMTREELELATEEAVRRGSDGRGSLRDPRTLGLMGSGLAGSGGGCSGERAADAGRSGGRAAGGDEPGPAAPPTPVPRGPLPAPPTPTSHSVHISLAFPEASLRSISPRVRVLVREALAAAAGVTPSRVTIERVRRGPAPSGAGVLLEAIVECGPDGAGARRLTLAFSGGGAAPTPAAGRAPELSPGPVPTDGRRAGAGAGPAAALDPRPRPPLAPPPASPASPARPSPFAALGVSEGLVADLASLVGSADAAASSASLRVRGGGEAEGSEPSYLDSASRSALTVPKAPKMELELPYRLYRLVRGDGSTPERLRKHPFCMSRVFYSAAERGGEEVWVQLADGSCRWRQTAGEIKVVALRVPPGLRAGALEVLVLPYSLSVRNRETGEVYLRGSLHRGIVPAESVWTYGGGEGEDGLLLLLQKMNLELVGTPHLHSASWWSRLLSDHADIAWDDYEKDYSDLPEEVMEEHRKHEAIREAERDLDARERADKGALQERDDARRRRRQERLHELRTGERLDWVLLDRLQG